MNGIKQISKLKISATRLLLLLPLAASCGDTSDIWGIDGEGDKLLPITLNIGTPSNGEVEYTRATQESSEIEINTLTVYDFLVKEHSDGSTADTLVAGVQYLRKKTSGAPEAGTFVSNAGGATAKLSLSAQIGSIHVFACVANEPGKIHFDSIMQPGVTPLDSLRSTPSTLRLKDGESTERLLEHGPVMTGLKLHTITENLSCNITLCRVMARVDVVNKVATTKNFKLLSVNAENCAATGFLFSQTSDKSFTAEKNDYSALVSQKQNTATVEALKSLNYDETCSKVLYLYEHRTDSCGQKTDEPTLIVKYSLNGSENTISVPMRLNDVRFNIQRNRLYKLIVGEDVSSTTARLVCTMKEEG